MVLERAGQEVVDGDADKVFGGQRKGPGRVQAGTGVLGVDAPGVVADFARRRVGEGVGPGEQMALAACDRRLDRGGRPELEEREAGRALGSAEAAGVVDDPVGGEGIGADA